jgi:type III pantothenate kinase
MPSGDLKPEEFSKFTAQIRSYPEITLEDVQEFIRGYPSIEACILSSVAQFSPSISLWLGERFRYFELDQRTILPIRNSYQSPETLGRDRIAAAVAGYFLFAGRDVLVINTGTAITYDLINSAGEYLGGSISPGMNMRFRALHTFSGKLPLITYSAQSDLTGKDTTGSILSGVIHGITAEVEGVAERYREQYPDLKIVFSGGDMEYFVNRLKISIFAFPNIVIYGLHKILQFNVENSS